MSGSLSKSAASMAAFSLLLGAIAVRGLATEAAPQPNAGWKDGAEVYAKVCAHCHEAGVGPVLRGRGLPAEFFKIFVRNGNRAMPAFRAAEIDDAALAQLGEYLAKP
jgi:mono/diheme cytochrome c family protein